MKISELVAQLQYAQKKFGDLEVVAYKNGKWMDAVEKLVHLEMVRNQGAPSPKASREEQLAWREDPQTQPNSGWLALKHLRGVNPENLAPGVVHRKLYIGPKVVVTS